MDVREICLHNLCDCACRCRVIASFSFLGCRLLFCSVLVVVAVVERNDLLVVVVTVNANVWMGTSGNDDNSSVASVIVTITMGVVVVEPPLLHIMTTMMIGAGYATGGMLIYNCDDDCGWHTLDPGTRVTDQQRV